MRWFVVASVAVWSASALAADVSDAGFPTQSAPSLIPLPPVVVPLGAGDVPNASSPTQRDPSATTTVIERKSRVAEAKDAAELIAASPGAVLQDQGGAGQRKTLSLRGASPNAVPRPPRRRAPQRPRQRGRLVPSPRRDAGASRGHARRR